VSELLAIGVSHKTAPVGLRERLALPAGRAATFLRDVRAEAEVPEAVAISTCNRTEIHLVVADPVEAESAALGMLARMADIRPTELAPSIYALRNCDAARHLFRVTSGLESMIVGEAEVQGQVRRAWEEAMAAGTTGPMTNHLFRAAVATGKRVRTETAIGERHLSVSSVAVALARDALGGLEGREAVVVGAGETSELTARALAEQGVETLFIANRRRERALDLARRYGGHAASFDELPEALERADIVITATSSPHTLLTAEEIGDVMGEREGRPLLMIDLAVPRDIDPACRDIPGIELHDVDDLQAAVARNRAVRRAEARKAESIVEEEIQTFAVWLGSLEIRPTLAALRTRADDIARQVVRENAGRWEEMSEKDRERVDVIARTVLNRFLHEPTLRLKDTDDGRAHLRTQVVRELWGLDEPEQQPLADVHELPRRARNP
jgi:glutamyl-tRNA reductase